MPASILTELTTNIEVVTDDQWNKLKIYYGYHGHDLENASANEKKKQDKYAFEPVSFSILPEGEAAIFNPPICQKCMTSSFLAKSMIKLSSRTSPSRS